MSGGAIAKRGFRYQDLCAMYFALREFQKEPSFQYLYCEQEKIDFEIWNTGSFTGFQVKTTASGLSAKEANTIFLYYLNKAVSSGKKEKGFWFVFGDQPVKSLAHLLIVIRNGTRGTKYNGHIKKYIDVALENIPIDAFSIDFHLFNEEQIQHLVFSTSAEVLKDRLGAIMDVPTEVVRDFIARFKNEIDMVSCKTKENERVYSTIEIGSFVDSFLARVKVERYEQKGRQRIEIQLPEEISKYAFEAHVVIKRLSAENIEDSDEGEPIKE